MGRTKVCDSFVEANRIIRTADIWSLETEKVSVDGCKLSHTVVTSSTAVVTSTVAVVIPSVAMVTYVPQLALRFLNSTPIQAHDASFTNLFSCGEPKSDV